MKKSVLSALAATLVLGAASTTFAAANPFSDVPATHWAYRSLSKLSSEGIVEGYPDGTYRGDRNITRFEMAQMIARALAKAPSTNMSASSRAELDKLAAEFREELDSLGVRVEELEKHADKIQWTGEVRYRYNHDNRRVDGGDDRKSTRSQLQIRLFPTAYINEHWTAKARFTASNNMRTDSTSDLALTFVYAEGKYGKFTVDLGKMPLYSNADQGLVADDFFSGLRFIYGDNLKFQLEGGGWSGGPFSSSNRADYVGAEILYDGDKFNGGLGYRYFKDKFKDKDSIFSVGAGYKITDKVKLSGAYAHNSKASNRKSAYNIELAYGGANKSKPQSWGVFAAYRYVGSEVGLAPTYDVWYGTTHKKGVEFGATYTPMKNIWTKISYFHGKTLDTHQTDKQFFGRVSFYF